MYEIYCKGVIFFGGGNPDASTLFRLFTKTLRMTVFVTRAGGVEKYLDYCINRTILFEELIGTMQ